MSESFSEKRLNRRAFLLSAGAGVVALALPGCGGGGASGSGGPGGGVTGTTSVTGTVKLSAFGGSNYSVVSAYQSTANVGTSGSFTTTVSSSGVQLLFLVDSSGELRGLALSVPDQPLTFNATSTAQGLLFLTPGLLTTVPSELAARISSMYQGINYIGFIDVLDYTLPVATLQQAVGNADVIQTLTETIHEYWSGIVTTQSVTPGNPVDWLAATVAETGPSSWSMQLSNAGWRFLRIDRLSTDTSGNPIGSPVSIAGGTNTMMGATSTGVGSFFNPNTAAASTLLTDPTPVDFTVVNAATYWTQGPGLPSGTALPSGIDNGNDSAWGESVVYYLFCPLLALLLGDLALPSAAATETLISALYNDVQAELNLVPFAQATSQAGMAAALGPLVQSLLSGTTTQASPFNQALSTSGVVPPTVSLSRQFEFLSQIFGPPNALIAATTWSNYGNPDSLAVIVTGSGTITVQGRR